MRQVFKTSPVARVKALTDSDDPGTFEALVSVFGNTDLDGDVVARGAFTKTLADGPKPIVWSHDWLLPPIGETIEASETDEGLYVKARLFIAPEEDHATARQVYTAMRAGALKEFSWGGRVTEETRRENQDGTITWILNEIDLVEYGPCLKGANPATQLIGVKSGRPDEQVTAALQILGKARNLADVSVDLIQPAHDLLTEALASKTSSPCVGGDPQQRARVASLLLP